MEKSISNAICDNVAQNVVESLIQDEHQTIIDLSSMYNGSCNIRISGSLNMLELDKYTSINAYIKVLCDLYYVESCSEDVQNVYSSVFMVALKKNSIRY